MTTLTLPSCICSALLVLAVLPRAVAQNDQDARGLGKGWREVGSVELDPASPKGFLARDGKGVRPLDRNYTWQQSPGSLALLNHDKTVWRLVFDPKEPKSYFHPLATIEGDSLTAFEPQDHPWHRGLWFSWKFINGLNYWEEDRKTRTSQGITEITEAHATPHPDFSATVTLALSYHPPGKPELLREQRRLVVSAADANGNYAIDWTSTFNAGAAPVLLDRTPPKHLGGSEWGGYGGLSLRFPPGLKGWSFTTSENIRNDKEGNGKAARWVDFSAANAGVAIFDHPGNPRHPSPWYLSAPLPYFGPALLFHEPLKLAAGESLTLRYRVLVHRGASHTDLSAHAWKQPD